MRRVMMCPQCGNIRFPDIDKTLDTPDKVCDYCNTERVDVGEVVEDFPFNYDSDRELFSQRIYRKFLYGSSQFDEETFECRLKGERDFREEIRQNVAKLPKCPTCSSTNIRHIGTGERAISVIGLGLFSGKIGKNYECLNCKVRW